MHLKNEKTVCPKGAYTWIRSDIIKEILSGVDKSSKYTVVENRREAILFALGLAKENDTYIFDRGYISSEWWSIINNSKAYYIQDDVIYNGFKTAVIGSLNKIKSDRLELLDGIIIPQNRCVQVNSTVIKTSVGTVENVKIVRVANLNNTIKYLKDNGYWIFGTDMEGTDYTKLDYRGKTCIICGNEGEGISKLVRDNCDFVATIPMKGKVNSLNASVATAIIVFEAVKQRG